jgi:hypothetical protein
MERRRFNKPPKTVNGKDGTSHIQHSLDEILQIPTTKEETNIQKPANIIPYEKKDNKKNEDNTPYSTGWVTDKWG